MRYDINLDSAIMRVNTRIRGEPEILLENCILVSQKDEDLKFSKIDRLRTIIYPDGCSNLDAPESVFIDADFRHSTYGNAGYFYNLRLSDDGQQLLGDLKIGSQHELIDKDKKVYGSSYAHALMAIAEKEASKPENVKASKTYKDFISDEAYSKYFKGKVVPPLTGLSVELDWTEEPQQDEQGVVHIKKYSIVRVSLLINDKTGQQQSRLNFNNIKFKNRSMDKELQSIALNIELFETGNILKIRDADLANEYLVYQDIKARACAMCEAEAKRKEEEAKKKREDEDAEKQRSEEALLGMIENLQSEIQALKEAMANLTNQSEPQVEATREAEDADPVTESETPVDEATPELVTPEPAIVEKTRIAKEVKTFDSSKY